MKRSLMEFLWKIYAAATSCGDVSSINNGKKQSSPSVTAKLGNMIKFTFSLRLSKGAVIFQLANNTTGPQIFFLFTCVCSYKMITVEAIKTD